MTMTIEDMRQAVKTDPETRHLEVSDNDLALVYQYLIRRNDHEGGYRPVLRTDPYVEIVYRPTKEKANELRKKRIRENLRFYDTEVYIQDASLDAFDVFNDERKKVRDLAQNFLDEYRKDKVAKGLYIFGKYATGKSYIMSAVAQALALRGITVLFVYMPDLVRSIKQGMNEGNLEERVNQLKQADVLMMDDIGGENMSTWFRDEVLVPVLQYRLSAQLPVFMTSNLDFVQLVEALTLTKDETGRAKAARLVQRIKDLMIYVRLSQAQYDQ